MNSVEIYQYHVKKTFFLYRLLSQKGYRYEMQYYLPCEAVEWQNSRVCHAGE